MPKDNENESRRSLLRIAGAAAVTIFGLARIASAAKERALEKKGYVPASKKAVKKKKKKAAKKKKKKKKKAAKKKKSG